ncbi:hypothetical protein SE17_31580 [Kouleothrix aurantiaca]|uniref:DinB-like domain-containing protein n=1 Tax=Kouleothrix aurantiaca TaxID=186479 RepID=A0A0N8PRD5_9CHLR|nr:hypothetical protein SE17_31580 [Kouleothrix aurantiaca]
MTLSNEQSALLALVDRAYAAQNAWIASLSDAERELVGTPERWSAKDMLAHVTFWQQVMIDRLNMVGRGETPTLFGDFQPVNERVFAERNALPWQQVLDEAAAAYAAASEHVRTFDTATLTERDRFAWNHNEPLVSNVLSNSYWHPLEHAARFSIERGDSAGAIALMDDAIVNQAALAVFPHDRATALFNLACLYATNGLPAQALALLPESLALRPDLIEWSKQDSDLDSIRDTPEFQDFIGK